MIAPFSFPQSLPKLPENILGELDPVPVRAYVHDDDRPIIRLLAANQGLKLPQVYAILLHLGIESLNAKKK